VWRFWMPTLSLLLSASTPRASEVEVRVWIADPCMRTWQVRLTDRFGDNGVVALMVARLCGDECRLTMLMSCRVLGRRLEEELLNLLGAAARENGAARITGALGRRRRTAWCATCCRASASSARGTALMEALCGACRRLRLFRGRRRSRSSGMHSRLVD
jgi:hypothetical protein